ncbi:MAG: hypothetical protein GQ574_08335 [Crocinitomix sp.]|nr:hypothetical protein [Crocinitomix sp.]
MKDLIITNSGDQLSSGDYEKFVNEFDLTLPESYKDLILQNNGGTPTLSSFGDPFNDGYHIEEFGRISLEDEDVLDLLESSLPHSCRMIIQDHQIDDDFLQKKYYSFAVDGGNNFYCIDMENNGIYKVWHDSDTQPRLICGSFEEFVNGMDGF